jgi:hypothetical protein
MVLLRYAHEQYTASNLYGAEKPIIVMPGSEISASGNQGLEIPNSGIDV